MLHIFLLLKHMLIVFLLDLAVIIHADYFSFVELLHRFFLFSYFFDEVFCEDDF